ncbi:MAG: polysaccharide pyruvyl transferase family protein [Sneathiella sp.]
MKKLAIFGAAPDTGNMGVSALFHSLITGLQDYLPGFKPVIMDNGWGVREMSHTLDDKRSLDAIHIGARGGKKYYRQENLGSMSLLSGVGALGSILNPVLKQLDECDAILDVSGGDSFSDIYGKSRFLNVTRPKLIALRRNIPLILLPQTYGPYFDPRWEKMAKHAVEGAELAWARDKRSFDILKNMLGSSFDETRHRSGIDMAFRLKTRSAAELLGPELMQFLNSDRAVKPVVGFNISGLIYQDLGKARSHYKFKADYSQLIQKYFNWLLEKTAANIVIIPHVMNPPGHYESDFGASLKAVECIAEQYRDRVTVSPNTLDQNQTKWLISKMDWFCGTRMHATIAGLSTGVPTSAVAYSDKTQGVFESCQQGAQVADPRALGTDEMVAHLIASFEKRDALKASLVEHLPTIKGIVDKQFELIANKINSLPAKAMN